MATLFLVRHGRTRANTSGVLAGWTPGVGLDDDGRRQAGALAARLAKVPLAAVVTSPLDRCRETARIFAGPDGPGPDGKAAPRPEPALDERLGEVKYGDWEGKELKKLAKEPLWKVVQQHPSGVTFPGDGGESLRSMADRAVCAVREWDAKVEAEHGPDAIWAAVSHGDVIKAIVADALGMHLDQFQRIVVDPCSVSVVQYTPLRSFVVRVNDSGGDLAPLVPKRRRRRRTRRSFESDAAVGGGAGPTAAPGTGPGTGATTNRTGSSSA